MPGYYLAFEIKRTERVTKSSAKNFRGLEDMLDKPLKRSYILSNDRETKYFDEQIVALNAAMFLG
jgi:predicted AAA+ superfamily ATPase